MPEKIRLDIALVEKGLAPSREKAKAMISAGAVAVDGKVQEKAGTLIAPESAVELLFHPFRYVSRGGLKLEKLLQKHGIDLSGLICIDIGASSGGFTDCMLQNGAQKVYAVDVGYDQLDPKLRADPRVVNLERTNIRYVTGQEIPEPIGFGSVDVSFISLTLVLPVLFELLKENGEAVCLVKPQFEAGKGKVGKNGVVKEQATHREVLRKISDFSVSLGFTVKDLDFSPITGPEGNIEYLIYLKKAEAGNLLPPETIKSVVERSHAALSKKKQKGEKEQ